VILIAFFLFEESGDPAEDAQDLRAVPRSPVPAVPSPELVTGVGPG